jgi:hypothetical protein
MSNDPTKMEIECLTAFEDWCGKQQIAPAAYSYSVWQAAWNARQPTCKDNLQVAEQPDEWRADLCNILYPGGIKHPQQGEWHWLLKEVGRLKSTEREYRPHPKTGLGIRINNALHSLNLDRNDIASLPDGATLARNVTDDRVVAALLEDLLIEIEDKPRRGSE